MPKQVYGFLVYKFTQPRSHWWEQAENVFRLTPLISAN
jgi:hypothetical protein